MLEIQKDLEDQKYIIKDKYLKQVQSKSITKKDANAMIKEEFQQLCSESIIKQKEEYETQKGNVLKEGVDFHHNNLNTRRKMYFPNYPFIGMNYFVLIIVLLYSSTMIGSLVFIEINLEVAIALGVASPILIIVHVTYHFSHYCFSPPNSHLNIMISSRQAIRNINIDDKSYKRYVHFQNGRIIKKKRDENYSHLFNKYVLSKSTIKERKNLSTRAKHISSKDFPPVGGIYAWVVNNEIVYIGRANNIKRRMTEHYRKLTSETSNVKKYSHGYAVSEIFIQVLAMTNIKEEQDVMESYFYWINNKPHLNSHVPMTLIKIQNDPHYREIMKRLS